jgi:drug/metabolite transporter (DMT)-like permease
MMAVGVGVAVLAAVCFELSYAIQALEARAAPASAGVRLALLGRLLRRPGWLGAIALSGLGFGLQVVALRHAPLSVVQPVLALGLVLLLALSARVLGERVGRRELAAAAGVIAGVALLVLAGPERGPAGHPLGLAGACAALGAVALAPSALRSVAPALLVAAATCGDALAALAINEVARAIAPFGLDAVAWAGLAAAAGLLAVANETTALQRAPASAVAPVVLGGQVALPVLLAPLVSGDRWGATPLHGGVIVLGLLLLVAAVALLARSPAVGRFRQEAAAA